MVHFRVSAWLAIPALSALLLPDAVLGIVSSSLPSPHGMIHSSQHVPLSRRSLLYRENVDVGAWALAQKTALEVKYGIGQTQHRKRAKGLNL